MHKLLNLIIALLLMLMACDNAKNKKGNELKIEKYKELEKAGWFIGKWQSKTSEGFIIEIWEKGNDSTFYGRSGFVKDKDTVESEKIDLRQINNELFYIPTVKDQNEGRPVMFKMVSSSGNQLVFENPGHDFPQKISYTKISGDSLLAEVSGIIKDKEKRHQFPMRRVK